MLNGTFGCCLKENAVIVSEVPPRFVLVLWMSAVTWETWLALLTHHRWTCSATQGKLVHLADYPCSHLSRKSWAEATEQCEQHHSNLAIGNWCRTFVATPTTQQYLQWSNQQHGEWTAVFDVPFREAWCKGCQLIPSVAFARRAVACTCPDVTLSIAVAAKTHQMVHERHGTSAGVFVAG